MIEELVAFVLVSLIAATAFVLSRRYALLDHREEREQRRWEAEHLTKRTRTADVVAIADKQLEMEQTMDKAFAVHEKRISELEVSGTPHRRIR